MMNEHITQGGPFRRPEGGRSKKVKRIIEWAIPGTLKKQTGSNVNIPAPHDTTSLKSTCYEALALVLPDPRRSAQIVDGKPVREPEGPVSHPQNEHGESSSSREMPPVTEELSHTNLTRSQEVVIDPPPAAIPRKLPSLLWDEVYETLRTDNLGLLVWYETVLSSESQRNGPDSSVQGPSFESYNNPVDQGSSTIKRFQMEEILDHWLAKGTEAKQEGSLAGNSIAPRKPSTSLRDVLRDSIESTPTDAIFVWVAACYAAEKVLLHPMEASEEDCKGVLYVISRIEWYCRLSKMLLEEEANEGENCEKCQPKLREAIVSLYQIVLSYLMAMVCIHFSALDFGLPSNVIYSVNKLRRGGLESVMAAERALPLFDEVRFKARLEGVLTAAREDLKPKTSPSEPAEDDNEDEEVAEPVSVKSQGGLLGKLNVVDPRRSIPQLQMCNPREPSHGFYHALMSTTQYGKFRDWSRTDSTSRLLCVTGGPGQGKTMLLTGVVQALLADKVHAEWHDSRQVSFFFFDHNRPHDNHPTAALRGLIWLILEAQPKLARHLTDQLASTNRDDFRHPRDFPAISAVFYKMLEDPELKQTYLVVDALDQCFTDTADVSRPGMDEFMFLITQSLAISDKIRWLVSIDSETKFTEALVGEAGRQKQYLHLDLGSGLLDSRTVQSSYIEARVKELAKEKRYDAELENAVVEGLCKQPFRNYLWVNIVCAALRADEVWYALDVVQDVKAYESLPELYEYVHGSLNRLPRGDGGLCIQVISTMALLHGPIQVDELECLVKLGKWVDIRNILRKCSAFLRDVDGKVWFLHSSSKKYTQDHIIDHSTASKNHSKLVRGCLDYLGSTLAGGSGTSKAAASYSLLHWITHLGQISDPTQDTDLREKLHWFLANHFLQWIEQLILHGQLSAAAAKLRKVDLFIQKAACTMPRSNVYSRKSPRVTLQAIIRDALLFIDLHQSTQTPPGVPVHNTLLFCPEESIIRSLWIGKKLPGLSMLTPTHRRWGRDSRMFLGHEDWTRSVAFSPDGQLLASGSDDETVRIWDVETGETQHKLVAEGGWIHSVAFSNRRGPSKGGVVAAGSDRFVTLWNGNTGRLIKKLNYSNSINSLAFSADARWLAVASSSSVDIWDINGLDDNAELGNAGIDLIPEIIPHDETVRSVVFSPDGRLLATGADDAKVRVWDVASICHGQGTVQDGVDRREPRNTSNPLYTFKGGVAPMNCVTFSADSRLIASGSDDGTSRVWQVESKGLEPIHTLEASDLAAINSVSFLPNETETCLASCTQDCIEIWDMRTGHKVGKATPQSSQTMFSPAFSPDGASIATGSTDFAVHMWYAGAWDLETRGTSDKQSQITGPVNEMALSPDGRTVATSHLNGHVKLWDSKTSEVIKEVDLGHSKGLYSMTFSPTGGMLLTSSADKTVGVCKVPSGVLVNRFLGHDDWVRCAAWSQDEKYVASASDDGTVRIWQVRGNSEEVAKITHNSDGEYATGVAFSPDGKCLVTCGEDKRILVWQKRGPDTANNSNSSDWHLMQTIEVDHTPFNVAVSPDSKRVVSYGRYDRVVKVYDMETGKESDKYPVMKIAGLPGTQMVMWFDPRFEDYVMTLYGARSLNTDSARAPRRYPYRIATDDMGLHITRDGKKFIFFPNAFGITASLVGEDFAVLGMSDGGIRVFSFGGSTPSSRGIFALDGTGEL